MNLYWAFDDNAAAHNPVPGWLPGMPSHSDEAKSFLTWYLDALVEFQDWQIRAVRAAGHEGEIAVLYPSFGMRPGDAAAAAAHDLDGTSPAERNGEVQRGYDFARQISGLSDENVAVYGTWGEHTEVIDYLAGLAAAAGLPVMAENSGGNTQAELDTALRHAARRNLTAFFLIRASELACDCNGQATFPGVARTYASLAW